VRRLGLEVAIAVAMAGAVAAAVVWKLRSVPPAPAPVAAHSPESMDAGVPPMGPGYSNIYAADYVGPERCGECHEKNYERWTNSLHRAMNRRADSNGFLGDFGGVDLEYAGGAVRFDTSGRVPTMAFARDGVTVRRFAVTRTIGSRYLQEYVGVQIEGPEPREDSIYSTETRLPFGYWKRAGRWLHQQYFDSWYGEEYGADGAPTVDAYEPDRTPWATRCAWCHNTYPFEIRAVRSGGDNALGHGAEQYFALAATIANDNHLPTDELVTVGISCESCHLGGREHADEDEAISFAPRSPDLVALPDAPALAGGRDNSTLINTICSQCHSTPAPRFRNGAAVRNSSEALDMAAGSCMSAIKCTDCHDPHTAGPGGGAPDRSEHLAACTGCHKTLADAAGARAHTGHEPADASCLDCHMPKMVQGVSHFVRSHRISSPGDVAMLEVAAPNACNLCHLDESIAWTTHELREGWGLAVAPQASWVEHYAGNLDAPVGDAWLASSAPAARIAAAAAYARSDLGRTALPSLLTLIDDPIAYYRMWTMFAVEDILGRRLSADEYDPVAPPDTRAAQARRLRSRLAAGSL
jgi:predicted CXXCH cytochrome family protein